MFVAESNISYDISSKNLFVINAIEKVINRFEIESLKRELSIVKNFTTGNKYIDVVVLGQFKAGKSSLINSLIGENVLPVGVIPVTSAITRLQYAPEKKAVIKFRDQSVRNVNIDEISGFITEEMNPKNIKQVELTDLFLPQLNELKNIRIVDTPGIGSIFKHNSDTTNQWLPEIGVALIIISSERPLSKDDIELLNNVKKSTGEIKIILSKCDLLSSNQLQEVGKYVKNSLDKEDPNNVLILPYSTLKMVNDNRKQVMEKILIPLNKNFSQKSKSIITHKINSIVQSCLSYLKVGLGSCNKTEKEKENLKNSIIDEHLKLGVIKNELDIVTKSYKDKNRGVVSNVVMSFFEENKVELKKNLEKEFNNWQGNLFKLSRKFEQWLENKLQEELLVNGEKAVLQLDEYIKEILKHFNLFTSSFTERLDRNIEKVLGIKLNSIALQIEIEKIKKPDISVSYSFDIHIDLLWFLFPMFIFREMFRKIFLSKIPYEVEKNLNRLTSDIAENISDLIEKNREIVSNYVYNELLTIENILKNEKKQSVNFEKAIEEIKKLQN